MTIVEFLYMSGCPSYAPALSRLREVLAEEQSDLDVRMIRVDTEAEALETEFRGSPSIRIDHMDIEGHASPPVGFTCRTYRLTNGSISPVPDKESIRTALRAAGRQPERTA